MRSEKWALIIYQLSYNELNVQANSIVIARYCSNICSSPCCRARSWRGRSCWSCCYWSRTSSGSSYCTGCRRSFRSASDYRFIKGQLLKKRRHRLAYARLHAVVVAAAEAVVVDWRSDDDSALVLQRIFFYLNCKKDFKWGCGILNVCA